MCGHHNGFFSYQTELVILWLNNTPALYDFWKSKAEDVLYNAKPTEDLLKEEVAKQELARILKNVIRYAAAPNIKGIYSDLLSSALANVSWLEVAEDLLLDILSI